MKDGARLDRRVDLDYGVDRIDEVYRWHARIWALSILTMEHHKEASIDGTLY